MVTPASLIVEYPEFEPVDQARIQYFITQASGFMNARQWDTFYDAGLTSLSAHFIADANLEGDADPGAPTSDEGGDVRTGYQQPRKGSRDDVWLGSTSYGRKYMHLRRLIFPARG